MNDTRLLGILRTWADSRRVGFMNEEILTYIVWSPVTGLSFVHEECFIQSSLCIDFICIIWHLSLTECVWNECEPQWPMLTLMWNETLCTFMCERRKRTSMRTQKLIQKCNCFWLDVWSSPHAFRLFLVFSFLENYKKNKIDERHHKCYQRIT